MELETLAVLDTTGVDVARAEEEVKECDLVGFPEAIGVLEGATELEASVLEVFGAENEGVNATDELEGVSEDIRELDETQLLE